MAIAGALLAACCTSSYLQPAEKFFEKGYAFLVKSNYEKAIADYTKAIRLGADDAWTFRWRGQTYLAQENYDKAIEDYETALTLSPDDEFRKICNERIEEAMQGNPAVL
ncbi:hypothetical protein FACS1894137_08930 [Spirochaetia bacterium]|nr:hypothetical protein FACS1894137_08930 [Spirochaetia bacterium]